MTIEFDEYKIDENSGANLKSEKESFFVRLMIKLRLAHTRSQAVSAMLVLVFILFLAAGIVYAVTSYKVESEKNNIVEKYGSINQKKFISNTNNIPVQR